MKKLKRIVIGLFVLILLVVVAIRIMLPRVAPNVASNALTKQMNTPVRVTKMNLGILRGKVGLDSFSIEQPNAFSNTVPLLKITNPQIDIEINHLFKSRLKIRTVTVDDIQLNIIRNADGIVNLQQLVPPPSDKEQKPAASAKSDFSTQLGQLDLANATITYTDYTMSPPLKLAITNLQLSGSDLMFAPASTETNSMPAQLELTANILQTGYPDGYVGAMAKLGVIQTNIPPVNAALRIVGFDLRSIQALIPTTIAKPLATTLGGFNLDLITDVSISETYLNVDTKLQTAKNTLRLNIKGTPQEPIIDKQTALFNLVTRPTAFLSGTVSDVTDAGVAAGQSVVATAGKAGEGLLSGIKNLGKGATSTIKGVAKGDIRGIGDGVRDMTIGTVTGAVDTVKGTAQEVGEGIGNTISAVSGQAQTKKWETENAERWAMVWQDAIHFVAEAPFPGTNKNEE
jgi:uncharacterized protein involved in outer membrane biogenesis